MKIGILSEKKTSTEKRSPLSPKNCAEIVLKNKKISFVIQPCNQRCFTNDEFKNYNIELNSDLSSCDFIIGIKAENVVDFYPNKTYILFSHSTKGQKSSKPFLQKVIENNITLIDFERIKDDKKRLITFGDYSAIAGVYNTMYAYGLKNNLFKLEHPKNCNNTEAIFQELEKVKLENNLRILVSGNGLMAKNVVDILKKLNIKQVTTKQYITKDFSHPTFCNIKHDDYYNIQHLTPDNKAFKSSFLKYSLNTKIFIAAHFWKPNWPKLFSISDTKKPNFDIELISDISCDINGPIPTTTKMTTIDKPFYSYNHIGQSSDNNAFNKEYITVMSVGNLPSQTPIESSLFFSEKLVKYLIPKLWNDYDEIINNATIIKNGEFTEKYAYLRD